MKKDIALKLRLPKWYDEGMDEMIRYKGFFQWAAAERADGKFYNLTFYDEFQLQRAIEYEMSSYGCFGEPGAIVLEEVSRENMEAALPRLEGNGFFDALHPVDDYEEVPLYV